MNVSSSFTLSQAGMAKHHIRLKEQGWKSGMVINGIGALLSFLVLAIVATVKFTEGAWVVVLLVPIMVVGLVRLNKAYEAESVELHEDAKAAAEAPTLRNHTVIVLVDNLDAATARAMQYARTLTPDDLRAVHFDLDSWKTGLLVESWSSLGFSRFPLDIIECPDRRMTRAALDLVSQAMDDNDTEVTILIPRREYTKLWHRMLHDRSSNAIAASLANLAHCNVTIVPYHLGSPTAASNSRTALPAAGDDSADTATSSRPVHASQAVTATTITVSLPVDRVKIADVAVRERAMVAGRVRAMRIQPWGGNPSLEVSLADESGSVTVVFFGRRSIGGVTLGSVMTVTGVVGEHRGIRAILNPSYTLLHTPTAPENPGEHH